MMKEKTVSKSLRLMFSGSVAMSLGMLAQPVLAQQSGDSATSTPVQRVEITGSNIRRIESESTSPIQVLTADDLKKSGYTTVAQVLQNITANGQGSLSNLQSAASFASGGTGVALRGLNTASTLVLIDGHRMAPYALPDNSQFAFVDINNIPFDTIEKIEVLKDGASAVYGSDAIAGVVNVILKKTFVGTKVNVEGGGTTEGGAATVHASIIHGFGDLDEDGYNLFASLEARHQNEVTYASREGIGQWSTPNFTQYGGNNKTPGVIGLNSLPQTQDPYLVPASGTNAGSAAGAYFQPGASCSNAQLNSAAGCKWTPYIQLAPETENVNFLTGFTKRLGDGWTLSTKASLFEATTTTAAGPGWMPAIASSGAPQAYVQGNPPSDGGVALSASNPPPGKPYGPPSIAAITVPANYPGNGLGVPAYVEGTIAGAPENQAKFESKSTRLVADLNGSIGDWDIKTSLGYTRNSVATVATGNTMNIPAFNAAINRPTAPFNVFSSTHSASDLATIYPDTYANSLSILEFGEAHATRSLMALPGGDLGFSTGVSYVHRELQFEAPNLVAQGVVPGNIAWASGEQNDASAYVEFALPVLKSLELDFDERFDHIDTYGNSVTGKAAFKWTPVNSFALRGSASTGFRAPNISEQGNAGSIGFFGTTYDPKYCPGGPNANGSYPVGSAVSAAGVNTCNYAPPVLTTGNSALKPERSVSLTLGAIFEPIKGWSSTFDLYKITVNDQIEDPSPNFQALTPVRSATPITAQCSVDGTSSNTTPCSINPVLYYAQPFLNLNSTMTDGFELGTSYKLKLGEFGTLKSELDWSHLMSYRITENGTTYQLAGTHGPSAISNDTGNPADRVQAIFTWNQGPLQLATSFNWISSFSITDPSGGQPTCASAAGYDGWFGGSTNPPNNYCRVASFLDTDVSANYVLTKQWSVHGSITNLFNRQPPVDLETYGNLGVAANTTLHSAGVMGRGFNIGATYNF